jgi:hypothetical protein
MLLGASVIDIMMLCNASLIHEDQQEESRQPTNVDRKEAARVDGVADRQRSPVWLDQSSQRRPRNYYATTRRPGRRGAMNCRLIYAIVPNDQYSDLEAIIDERARDLAQQLVRTTEHSMRLEKQGADDNDLAKEVDSLKDELKSKMDSRIWGKRTRRSPTGTQK